MVDSTGEAAKNSADKMEAMSDRFIVSESISFI